MANSDFNRKYRKLIKSIQDPRFLNSIGKQTVQIIQRRTQSGTGISVGKTNGLFRQVKLAKLSPSYVNYRKGIVKFTTGDGKTVTFKLKNAPRLSALTSGGQRNSNLTLTGQMVGALRHKLRGYNISIEVKNTPRSPDRRGGKSTSMTNQDLAEYHHNEANPRRRFVGLDNISYRIIAAQYNKYIRKQIRKIFR